MRIWKASLGIAVFGFSISLAAQQTATKFSTAQSTPSATSAQAPQNPRSNPSTAQRASSGNADVSEQKDVVYETIGGHDVLLDVYSPIVTAQKPRPAIVLIHGGGWIAFDKNTLANMGRFLAQMGYVAFAVNYRLLQGSENRWPAQLDDVQRAVRWIRANADKYGVNSDRIGAFGHSAGAQLAALLGMEDTRDNSDATLAKYSSRVQAVVDVSGPSDLTLDNTPDDAAFLTNFFGADFATRPDIWRDASPAFHAAKNDAPFLILHGTRDQDVPMAQAQELYDKLNAAGVPVKLVKVDDVHTFTTPEARRVLLTETMLFFQQYLGGGEIQ
jgi:acetyl esterase/lipase